MMTVKNMMTNRGNKAANQFVICNGFETTFQSYNSTIAVVNHQSHHVSIGKNWDYSTTTNKYRNQFFKEHYLPELANKKAVETALKNGYIDVKSYNGVNRYTVEMR